MPYASKKQAAFMHIHHPEIAEKWHEEGHGYVKGGKNDPGKKRRRRVRKGLKPVLTPEQARKVIALKKAKKGKTLLSSRLVQKDAKGWVKPVVVGVGTGTVGGALANQFPSYEQRQRRKAAKRAKKGVAKSLAPTWPDDGFFNAEAAQKTFDLIMKMDDDSAQVFCYMVASDLLEQEVENNYDTLQKHLNQVVGKRLDMMRKATLSAVSKRSTSSDDADDAVAYAQALALISAEISKADDDIPNWQFERKISRDPSSGRFRTKFSQTAGKVPVNDKTAAEALKIGGTDKKAYKDLTPRQKALYQKQYLEMAQFLGAVHAATGGEHDTLLHLRDKKTGETYVEQHASTAPPIGHLADKNTEVLGAESRPRALTVGGTAFSLAGAMGTNLTPGQVTTINTGAEKFGTFSDQWANAGTSQPDISNARLYSRTQQLGNVAYQMGPDGSKVQLAGKMAEIVGQYGPQAEKVIGPSARKTAYRYRGTERTPDKRLVEEYDQAIKRGKAQGPRNIWAEREEVRVFRSRGGQAGQMDLPERERPRMSLQQVAQMRQAAAGRAPEWGEREPGRAAVVRYLQDRLPNRKLYMLQLESGNTPPSEGVMINANGQIVSQAVGYGDDHYLPFNLKNLKSLKGGEYVRTRSVGGITAEDVYTGLMSGARRVTVVSRSGTFTMEFQPDFRGGRRYNDKARRMTRRYEQILDAVQSEQVERQDVPPKWKKIIENEVRSEYPPSTSNRIVRAAIDQRMKEFKENPQVEGRDADRAEIAIANMERQAELGTVSRQDAADYRKEVMNELQDMKEIKYRLNGVGYTAALDALEEQFPYYIHAHGQPKQDHLLEFERDRGYVEPGRNRPTGAKAGWHGTQTRKLGVATSSGKFSAAHADYQRGLPGTPEPAHRPNTRTTEAEDKTATPPGTPRQTEAERQSEALAEATNKAKAMHGAKAYAVALQQTIPKDMPPPEGAVPEWWGMGSEQFRGWLNESARNLEDFRSFASLPRNKAVFTQNGPRELVQFQNAVGAINPKKYTAELGRTFPPHPLHFDKADGAAYGPNAKPEDIEIEMNRLDGEDFGLVHNQPLSSLSIQQMGEEVDGLTPMIDGMKAVPGLSPEQYQAELGASLPNTPFTTAAFSLKGMDAHLKRVHQMRYLKSKGGTVRQPVTPSSGGTTGFTMPTNQPPAAPPPAAPPPAAPPPAPAAPPPAAAPPARQEPVSIPAEEKKEPAKAPEQARSPRGEKVQDTPEAVAHRKRVATVRDIYVRTARNLSADLARNAAMDSSEEGLAAELAAWASTAQHISGNDPKGVVDAIKGIGDDDVFRMVERRISGSDRIKLKEHGLDFSKRLRIGRLRAL